MTTKQKAAPAPKTVTPEDVRTAIIADVARSVKDNEGAFYNAVVGVGFLAAYSQTFEIRAGRPLSEKKFETNWNDFLKHYIAAGHITFVRPKLDADGNPVLSPKGKPLFEPCREEAEQVKALKGDARNKRVNELWGKDTRPKGYRVAKHLARIKTVAKALSDHIVTHNGTWIHDLLQTEKDGADKAGLASRFKARVADTYGASGTELETRFQGGGTAKPFDAGKWAEKIIETANKGRDEVSDEVLLDLIQKLELIRLERGANAEILGALTGSDAPAEDMSDEELDLAA